MKLLSLFLICIAALLMVLALPIVIVAEYTVTLAYLCSDLPIWRNRCLRIKQRLSDAAERLIVSISIVKEVFR